MTVDYRIEVFVLPVTDVDRAKHFYEAVMGWNCDVDHAAGDHFRVVQLTPPGSDCSITFGLGVSDPSKAGQYSGMHLCVRDIEAAIADLKSRGAPVGDPYWFGADGQQPGLHPERARFGTYAEIVDPDGNQWVLQEVNDNPTRPPT